MRHTALIVQRNPIHLPLVLKIKLDEEIRKFPGNINFLNKEMGGYNINDDWFLDLCHSVC